jgi:hypothetical protein
MARKKLTSAPLASSIETSRHNQYFEYRSVRLKQDVTVGQHVNTARIADAVDPLNASHPRGGCQTLPLLRCLRFPPAKSPSKSCDSLTPEACASRQTSNVSIVGQDVFNCSLGAVNGAALPTGSA